MKSKNEQAIVLNRELPAIPEQPDAPHRVLVHLAPASGEVEAEMLSGDRVLQRFSPESLQRVAVNFTPGTLVDFEHRSLLSDDTTAGAWINEPLQVQQDGLFGLFDFTDLGWEAVVNKRIRFQSPVFALDVEGYPVRLINVALTNRNNLKTLRPILNKQSPAEQSAGQEGDQMKEIAIALGLTAEADQAAVLNKLKEVLGRLVTLQKEIGDLHAAALNKEADEFVGKHAALIKDPAAVKAQFVANKDATIAVFATIKPPAASTAVPVRRTDGKTPDGQVALNKSREQSKFVAEVKKRDACDFQTAWDRAAIEKPELFKEEKAA